MITIFLSERDFDYEIQALVNSFFPGERSQIVVRDPQKNKDGTDPDAISDLDHPEAGVMRIAIILSMTQIRIAVQAVSSPVQTGCTQVTGAEDWHKREGKKAHPYRTYYKNELKKLLFTLLRDYPEEYLTSLLKRRIPAWGTMTGVRPTKITMNQLLSGATENQVREELRETYLCSPEKVELGMQIATREAALLEKVPYEQGYSLYISVPFCPTTCLYCSFPSYPLEQFGHYTGEYLQALKKEISAMADVMKGRPLSSIYIGGGTPTAFSAEQLRELIGHVRSCYPVTQSYEFTVEAGRPDSITSDKLQALRDLGVDRISVNPQTMQQQTLELIGRRHTVEDTREAFALARKLGFSNINMDLIIGLPGETVSDFQDTLRQIKALDPDSVTIHSLVIKRASRLRTVLEEQAAKGQIPLAELERKRGEQMEQMLLLGQEFAAEQGYAPYYMYRQKNSAGHAGSTGQENIGYARPGSECLYNILIMEEKQTILAVGAGASTKLYHPSLGQVSRVENVKSVIDYIARVEEMIQRKYQLLT
ncbi:MAG: coproporphyrinogen dehydrogenase HemZ [Eubacteriales bacterium]|nr:coproporphyrinogen dehydrogenase HemZ [Eubacteriales bacterium]